MQQGSTSDQQTYTYGNNNDNLTDCTPSRRAWNPCNQMATIKLRKPKKIEIPNVQNTLQLFRLFFQNQTPPPSNVTCTCAIDDKDRQFWFELDVGATVHSAHHPHRIIHLFWRPLCPSCAYTSINATNVESTTDKWHETVTPANASCPQACNVNKSALRTRTFSKTNIIRTDIDNNRGNLVFL